jgi:hypothetical protein
VFLDASGELPLSRHELGRIVREAWVRWAELQPHPKESWLVPYHELPECDRDADDDIGEAVARAVMLAIAARNGSPAADDAANDKAKRADRIFEELKTLSTDDFLALFENKSRN